ncbi:phosphatase PAP2 family protein [Gordonia sp. L191]|uniref:phosphatase PAP2 family protein n=1 Tax=Gordonia sp. L191 TaxID=2982699 RepID=UPI0024C0C6B0|nr:phosphatase PAP2 family protein [Gordonia sp. L191]WHU46389.1 phosphatase PAP2 family protein [Gordonia sp. L191]
MSVDEAIDVPSLDDRRRRQAPEQAVRESIAEQDDNPGVDDPGVDEAGTDDAGTDATSGADDPPELGPILADIAAAAEMEAEPEKRRDLTMVRRVAIVAWALFMVWEIVEHGLAFDRTRLIILLCLGLIAASIGRRRVITVVIDWAPFALILLLYDWTRNVAEFIQVPVAWHLAPDVDKDIFGVVPTVWLQEHLKSPSAPWWEVITSVVYMSYFVVPYALAAILWLRDRATWRRFAACFIATTFLGLIGYTFVPAAPPWAAARCTAAEVADGPREAICMTTPQATEPGGILGPFDPSHAGAAPYVERISARGWEFLNIHVASNLIEIGQGKSNLVAAIPSLHAALTMLLALFMWPRVKALGRTLFLGYAFAMAFTLVYTAEHYVFDILLGWALAALVVAVYQLVDRKLIAPRNKRRAQADAEASPVG